MPVVCKCRQCNVDFSAKPSAVASGRAKFCSYSCRASFAVNARVRKVCGHCGTEFTLKPSSAAGGEGKFCSKSCRLAHEHVPKVQKECQQCGFVFLARECVVNRGQAKFCSRTCAASFKGTKHGHAVRGSKSSTYSTWQAMLDRCNNVNASSYYLYGGAGVTVCQDWIDFHKFLCDMGEKPPGKSLDRIDGSEGYSKENCRWATAKEQQRNLRTNVWVTYKGEQFLCGEVAEKLGVSRSMIAYRVKNWPEKDWFLPPSSRQPVKSRKDI